MLMRGHLLTSYRSFPGSFGPFPWHEGRTVGQRPINQPMQGRTKGQDVGRGGGGGLHWVHVQNLQRGKKTGESEQASEKERGGEGRGGGCFFPRVVIYVLIYTQLFPP